MYDAITQEFKINSQIEDVVASTEALAAANVKMLDDLHQAAKNARQSLSEDVNNKTSTPATGRPRRGTRALPTSRRGSESDDEVRDVAEEVQMKKELADAKEKKRARDVINSDNGKRRKKENRRRLRAETKAADEAEAADLVARANAKAAAAAHTSPPPFHGAGVEHDPLLSQPNVHLAFNRKMDNPTAANPDANRILLAVMASLTRHDAALNRIKNKALESRAVKLEAKITRMKEEHAASVHHHDVLAAFKLI